MKVGFGYDSHRLVRGRKLIIGGIEVTSEKGAMGYSDADVLCHAVTDAIIGALGMGDIGSHFPDSDPKWKDAVSLGLLKHIVDLANKGGYAVVSLDTTVVLEEPRLAPFLREMKESIALTGIPAGVINIKVKTNEGMGFIGQGEGIAAYAVCLLDKI